MPTISQPDPTARQVCGTDPAGTITLAVVAKRTYRLTPDGRCVPADEQLPLVDEPVIDADTRDRFDRDTDLYPYKPLTDVVVKGHATTFPARPRFDAAVELKGVKKVVAVIGDRMAALTGSGEVLFAPPTPVTRVPLRYDKAYGGLDAAAMAKYGDPMEELRPFLPPEMALPVSTFYSYPRNPCGTGYLFEPTVEAVNTLVLPNLEDPLDLLTPQRLLVGQPGLWPRMPIPHAFDWTDPGSFPRVAYSGIAPVHDPFDGPLSETTRGWAPDGLLTNQPMAEKFSCRIANGASLGLQLPYLKGDEEVRLTHIHPEQRQFVVRLPGERPKIWVDGRKGTLKETEPVLHTVEVDLDRQLVSVVWRGAAIAVRQYMEEELQTMPLKVIWP